MGWFKMNKIKVSEVKEIPKKELVISKNEDIELNVGVKDANYQILVKEDAKCNVWITGSHTNLRVEIIENKNSQVQVSSFLENSNCQIEIDLNGEEATANFSYSILSQKESKNQITVFHNASNTKSKVICNGLSDQKAPIILDVNGYIPKSSKNCSCNQDSRILELENSTSEIHPNLYIENYEVEASHSAYIGPFKKEELFYLESRGIPEKEATGLLVKSLLLGKLSLNEKQKSELIEKIEGKQLVGEK